MRYMTQFVCQNTYFINALARTCCPPLHRAHVKSLHTWWAFVLINRQSETSIYYILKTFQTHKNQQHCAETSPSYTINKKTSKCVADVTYFKKHPTTGKTYVTQRRCTVSQSFEKVPKRVSAFTKI